LPRDGRGRGGPGPFAPPVRRAAQVALLRRGLLARARGGLRDHRPLWPVGRVPPPGVRPAAAGEAGRPAAAALPGLAALPAAAAVGGRARRRDGPAARRGEPSLAAGM